MNPQQLLSSPSLILMAGVAMSVSALPAIELGDLPTNSYVIEAEDFDYDGGQAKAQANTMPYPGNAYAGLSAVHGVDYFANEQNGNGEVYRTGESPNVPLAENLGGRLGQERPGFVVDSNYRIGWVGDGEWYNYSRTLPAGYYRAYAALSIDNTASGAMRGRLGVVAVGHGSNQQTAWDLGSFSGPGSGGWGQNQLVPLRASDGSDAVFRLPGGPVTLRFTTGSGDFDWFTLAPTTAEASPADLLVRTNAPAPFVGDGLYQVTPDGSQVVTQSVPASTTAPFEIQVQNEAPEARSLTLRLAEGPGTGWIITARVGGEDVTAAMLGTAGYATAALDPLASVSVVLECKPNAAVAAGVEKAAVVAVFGPGPVTSPLDAVKVVTRTTPTVRPDLLVRRDVDAGDRGDNVYNPTGIGQSRTQETAPGQAAGYWLTLGNDGNQLQAFRVTALAPPAGWRATYLHQQTIARFDGVDDAVAVGNWSPGPRWTAEAWVSPTATGGSRRTIVGGFAECLDWGITMADDKFGIVIRQPGGCTLTVTGGDPIQVGTWYHVAGTCDGAKARLYVQGVEVASADVDPNYGGTASGVRIGSEVCCGGNSFPGFIDEVRIWNRALDIAMITSARDGLLSSAEDGLLGYWRFDEGTGDTTRDWSAHNRAGTLLNGVAWQTRAVDVTEAVQSAGWESPQLEPGSTTALRAEFTPGPDVGNVLRCDILAAAHATGDAKVLDAARMISLVAPASNVPVSAIYTTSADFEKGRDVGVDYETVPDQIQLAAKPVTLPFLFVPNSVGGSVSKIDTRNGRELARYRTGPQGNENPSRTTIDLNGNCYVANRFTGTAVKIGLLENGQWIDRNQNGMPDTSQDLNGDGDITGEEMLPWGADECVLYEVVLIAGREGTYAPGGYLGEYARDDWNPGPRSVAVDAQNNLWVGSWGTKRFHYVEGSTGRILRSVDVSSVNHTPYGAVIDAQGIVWSASYDKGHVLRLNPSDDTFRIVTLPHTVYGLGLDSAQRLFIGGWQSSKLSRLNVLTGALDWTLPGVYETRGVAVTPDGTVWTANSGPGTVAYFTSEGRLLGQIPVGSTPTGVAVDAAGKVWVVNYGDEYIKRIDPAIHAVDLSKRIIGGRHYGYSDMTGFFARNTTTLLGLWSAVHDGAIANTVWDRITWHGEQSSPQSIIVRVRSSNDRAVWSPWETAASEAVLTQTPPGRYLEIEVSLRAGVGLESPVLKDIAVNARAAAPADLSVALTQPAASGRTEHDISLEATVRNHSSNWASGVVVSNGLPAALRLVGVEVPGGAYSVKEGMVEIRYPGLAGQASARYILTVQSETPGQFTHTASVRANETDPNLANNTAQSVFTIQPLACVSPTHGAVAWLSGNNDPTERITGIRAALFSGAGFTEGRVGQALNFDGADDYLELPDRPELRCTTAVTIEFWARRGRLGVDVVLEKGGDWNVGEANYGVGLHNINRNMFYFWFRGGWRGVRGVQDQEWHHFAVVAVHGQTEPQFYVDGEALPVDYRDGAARINLYPSTRPLHVGAQVDPRANVFGQLALDELAIYNRALSAEEVLAVYDTRSAGKCGDQLRINQPETLAEGVVGTPYEQVFSAEGGVPPYRFTLVSGALAAGLTLSADGALSGAPQSAATASLQVRVTDAAGAQAERTFALRTFACVPAPSGLIGWWPGNGNSDEVIAGLHGFAAGQVSYSAGRVGNAFRFIDHGESLVTVSNAPALLPSTRQLTIEAWVKPDFTVVGDKLITVLSKRDGCGTFSYHLGVSMGHRGWTGLPYFGFSGLGGFQNLDVLLSSKPVPDDGQWHHLAATYNPDKAEGNAMLYLDGEVVGNLNSQKAMPAVAGAPVMGRHGGCGYYSSAGVDELSLYDRELSPTEITAIINAGPAGKCFVSPADLLVRRAGEPESAYGLDGVYQVEPAGGQVRELQSAAAAPATYMVKVQNDSDQERSFVLRAKEEGRDGWIVQYQIAGADLGAALVGPAGYQVGPLVPGGSLDLTVTAQPTSARGGAVSRIVVSVSRDSLAMSAMDAVALRTTSQAVVQPDLLVRRDSDASFVGDDLYQAQAADQVRRTEIMAGGTARFQVMLENDGNVPARFRLQATAAASGWTTQASAGAPALVLDGFDDYLEVPDEPRLNPRSFTLECWVHPLSLGGSRVMLAKPYGLAHWDSWALWLQDRELRAIVQDAAGRFAMLTAPWPFTAGTWHHVAYAFDDDANRHTLLIDGESKATADTDVNPAYDARPLVMGADIENGAYRYFLHGAIRDVVLWNRARSVEEVASAMNRRPDLEDPALIGFWPLDDGSGAVAADLGSGALTARLVNDPAWSFLSPVDVTSALTAAGGGLDIMLAPRQSYELSLSLRASDEVPPGGSGEVIFRALGDQVVRPDAVRAVATVELDSTVPVGGIYDTGEDFGLGTFVGVDGSTAPGQIQLATGSVTLPFLWVPNSNEGTVSKVDVRDGRELGRYRTCPVNLFGNPSRTTVDQRGNCWVANRRTGTAVQIGLAEGGAGVDRNGDGVIQTSRDLDGDGLISGAELLPFGEDECVLWEVVLIPGKEGTFVPGTYQAGYSNDDWNPGPRGVAVDRLGFVWVGNNGANDATMRKYYKIDGITGTIVATVDVSALGHTAYGAVVDRHGTLWSSGQDKRHVLRLNTVDHSARVVAIPHYVYGINVDNQDHVFISGWQDSKLTRVNALTDTIDWTREGVYQSRGIAITSDGDVWVANSGPGTVTRWSNDGVIKKHIPVGDQPTGVAVDALGKVWAVNYGDGWIRRIDPDTDVVTLGRHMPGTQHYGYSDMTGIVSRQSTVRFGTWSVIHNARMEGAPWGRVTWDADVPLGAFLEIRVRSAQDGMNWSAWETAVSGEMLTRTPPGRYLQVEVAFRDGPGDLSPIVRRLQVEPLGGAPQLAVTALPDGRIQIAHAVTLEAYVLESAARLWPQPPAWQPAPEQGAVVEGQVRFLVQPSEATRFFRLRHR